MGIYIKGMEMPKNCAECPVNLYVCQRGYEYLLAHPELYDRRADDCPISYVPAADVVPVRHGKWIVKGQDIYCSECNAESAYNPFGASKFSVYCPNCGARMDGDEAHGCDKVKDRTCPYLRLLDKLAASEDAEDQGRLVILPCKVGDTIYAPTRNCISEFRVSQFDFGGYEESYLWVNWYLTKGITGNFRIDGIRASEIGKTVFLSREEAEAALKGERNDV